jgi:hypothetical protein
MSEELRYIVGAGTVCAVLLRGEKRKPPTGRLCGDGWRGIGVGHTSNVAWRDLKPRHAGRTSGPFTERFSTQI